VSNGFEAPSLAAQAYQNTSNGNFYTDHTVQAGSAQAIALGATALKPENSRSFSVGLVSDLWAGASLTVDAYRIYADDRIALSTTFREGLYPGSGALVTAAGFGAQDGVRYFINAADTRTQGVEATLEQRLSLGDFGTLQWTLSASYNEAKITGLADTPAVLAQFNIPVFSTGSQNDLLYKAPRSKQVLGLNWDVGRYHVGLRESHYGAIQRYGSPTTVATTGPYAGQAEIAYDIGGLWITDLELGLKASDSWSFALNANNLFDRKVTKLPDPLLASNEYYRYANGGPIDGSGGSYSATVRYRW
jgi:iron complex outermembrane receptor protein